MNRKIIVFLILALYALTLLFLMGYGVVTRPSDISRYDHTTIQEINAQGQISKEWKYVKLLNAGNAYIKFDTGVNIVYLNGIDYRVIYLYREAK